MTIPDVYVYELLAVTNPATEDRVRKVTFAVLDTIQTGRHSKWTVAVTKEQAQRLTNLPGCMGPVKRGQMRQSGDRLEWRDPASGELLSVSIEALD